MFIKKNTLCRGGGEEPLEISVEVCQLSELVLSVPFTLLLCILTVCNYFIHFKLLSK